MAAAATGPQLERLAQGELTTVDDFVPVDITELLDRAARDEASRARAAGSLDVLGNRTQVSAVLGDLSRVIARIHAARGIVIDAECSDDIFFRGERQDLEEMLGNLMDNASKWSKRQIRVRATPAPPNSETARASSAMDTMWNSEVSRKQRSLRPGAIERKGWWTP